MKILGLKIAIFALLLSCTLSAQSQKGYLLIIGGGNRPDYMMLKIIELAGGPDAKITIIPMASSEPIETAEYQKKQFESFGAADVDYIYCTNDEADSEEVLKKLSDTSGIFFSGGDQSRLAKALNGTKLLSEIFEIYNSGGIVSGTSAGAAVMSKIMITGDELINDDSVRAFSTIQKGNIVTDDGFGFIDDVIIDQHFIRRKRLNRLISIVLENPSHLGIGIDESTAIVVNPDNTLEVLGERQVIIFNAADTAGIDINEKGLFSVKDMNLDILINGQKYDLTNKSVIE